MVVSAVVRRWAPLRRSGWMVQFQPGRAAVGLCVPHDISRIVSPGDSCSATAVSAAPSSSSSSSSSFSSVGAGAVASARHALMKRAAWSPLHDGLSMRPSHEQRGGATAPAARTFASEGAAPAGGGMAAVIEITDESQLEGVVTASVASGTALIFDFYANWCGPCKVLTPKIEALVRGTNGAAALVKINVDDHPNISDQLRIQSLPTVMLMVQGRFVDTFKGVLPDPRTSDEQLKAFVDKAVAAAGATSGTPPESPAGMVEAASPKQDPAVLVDGAFAALESGVETAREDAARALSHVLAEDSTAGPALKARAYAGVARCALLATPPDVDVMPPSEHTFHCDRKREILWILTHGAREMVKMARKVVDGNFTEPEEVGAAAARTELVASAIEAGVLNADGAAASSGIDDVAALRETAAGLDKDAADDARHTLALRLIVHGDAAGAIDVALEMVKKGDRERGRELCVRLMDALGPNDPIVNASRRRLSNLWFV